MSLRPKGQGQKVYTRPQGSPVQKLPRPWGGSSLAIAKPEQKLRLCSRPTTGRLSIVCRRRKNFIRCFSLYNGSSRLYEMFIYFSLSPF